MNEQTNKQTNKQINKQTNNSENNGVVFFCSATTAVSTSVPAVDRLQITDRAQLVVGYDKATLSGLPDYQFRRLQSAINAAARSIFNLPRSDHATPALMDLPRGRAQSIKSTSRLLYTGLPLSPCICSAAPFIIATSRCGLGRQTSA